GLIKRYSTIQDYEPLDLPSFLEQQRLFEIRGEKITSPVTSRQSVVEYVASFHSRASLSEEKMLPGQAAAFDNELFQLVQECSKEDMLELQTVGRVAWGKPL